MKWIFKMNISDFQISKYTKMEKVDILDMTVRYLKGQRPGNDQFTL